MTWPSILEWPVFAKCTSCGKAAFNCKSLVGISYFVCGWIHFIFCVWLDTFHTLYVAGYISYFVCGWIHFIFCVWLDTFHICVWLDTFHILCVAGYISYFVCGWIHFIFCVWPDTFHILCVAGYISYFVCGWIHFISFQSAKKCSTYPKRFYFISNLKVKISRLFDRQHTNKMWAPPTKIKLTLRLIKHNTMKAYRGVAV